MTQVILIETVYGHVILPLKYNYLSKPNFNGGLRGKGTDE